VAASETLLHLLAALEAPCNENEETDDNMNQAFNTSYFAKLGFNSV
jgi:hypothetical protein